MPSSDDLPTPEPAKMPSRWPRPHGHERVERAHAERRAARSIRGAASGDGRRAGRRRAARPPSSRAPPSIGRPRPSSTRPSSSSPTRHAERARRSASTGVPGADAAHLAERHQQRAAVAEADHLGRDRRRGCGRPTIVHELADLGAQAGGLDDEADQVRDAAAAALQVGVASTRVGGSALERRAVASRRRPRARRATSSAGARRAASSMRASISPSSVRTMQPPRLDPPLGDDVERGGCRRAARRCSSAASRTSSKSSGFTSSTSVVAVGRAQRSAPATTSSTSSGRTSSARADDLLGERERELDGAPLGVRDELVALGVELAGGGRERRRGAGSTRARGLRRGPRRSPASRPAPRPRRARRARRRDDLRGARGG